MSSSFAMTAAETGSHNVLRKPISRPASALLRRYYAGPNHPFKLRLWGWVRRFQDHRRFTIPYGSSGWLTVDERCFLQKHIFLSGSYEPEVAEALLGFAGAREVIWDVGANIGSFAVLARLDPRVDEVICCEPDPENRAVLGNNLSLNRGARYQVLPVALSDHAGQAPLHPGPLTNRGLSSLIGGAGGDEVTCNVECQTLDNLVFDHKLPAPTLIKLDVEGWEHNVFLGAQRVLQHLPPKAVVFESRCDASGEMVNRSILELLADHGYHVTKIRRGSPSVDEQENFVAVRRSSTPNPQCPEAARETP
jgi:FkbM family methyltransferase